MIVSVHQPHYLPWLGYFGKILRSDVFVILDNVQYKKREFQNRNQIKTPSGPAWLTVPVITHGHYEQMTGDVRIDPTDNWRAKHLRAIEMSYGKAPFFNKYYQSLEALYMGTEWNLLMDLSAAQLRLFFEWLGIRTPVRFERELGIAGVKTERIANICKSLNGDTYLSGSGGKDYMDESVFGAAGLKLAYQKFEHPVYPQLHGDFKPYMSIVDLVFNCGEESLEIIRISDKTTV
jgi:hypothetical protein